MVSDLPAATPPLLAIAAVGVAGVLLVLAGAVALVTGLCWLEDRAQAARR